MVDAVKQLFSQIDRGAWVRFFIALAGLGLAFASAMLSTVFRETGNVWGVAVSASLALLIAGFVGLYTVPYLAKRVALERVRDVFDYDVTREGVIYLAIVLVITVAALNTGNNLLFIIIAAMLAAVLVSGLASAVVLRGIRLELALPAHIFAGQPVMARLSVRNVFPVAAFSISVVPSKPKQKPRREWQPSLFAWPANRSPEKQWVRWRDLKYVSLPPPPGARGILEESVYMPYVPARSTISADVTLEFVRRGRYQQEGIGISTRFPFSFLVKTRRLPLSREVLVYPAVEITEELEHLLPVITGEFETQVRGRGYDLYLIRDYAAGDSARHVDWKASAKTGVLKVREFTQEDEPKVRIVFDNPSPEEMSGTQYEAAVRAAASLAWHFYNAQAQVCFVMSGEAETTDIYKMLGALAVAEPQAGGEDVLRALGETEDFKVIFTARPRGTIATQLWAGSYVIYMQELSAQ